MDLEKFVNDNKKYLQEDNITNITKHKIKYVSNYIENWTYIMCEHNKINTINFIDCMCNAGIYNDCTLSTSMEVLNIFVNQAIKYPGMKFNIFLNDILPERIDVIKKLSSIVNSKNLNNINIFYDTMDVNDYLDSIVKYNTYFQFGSSTVLFVDPYNFGDVKIHKLYEFSNKYYSEIIFNYFSSDYKRNIKNESAMDKIDKINESMIGIPGYNSNLSDTEVRLLIQDFLKTSKIKYSFAYQFRTSTNVPLYSIIYASPHYRGLEEIKESFWKIFDGDLFYRNTKENDIGSKQISLIDDKQLNEDYYCNEAKNIVISKYSGYEVTYDEILIYLLEHSMLKKGQILRGVIKPLIKENKIEKLNYSGKNNYLNDSYLVKGK